MTIREARVKAKYRDWYPGLDSGAWYPAAWVAERVREQLLHGEPRWALSTRVLADDHFAFRGGETGQPTDMRTRSSDEGSLDREHQG